MYAPSATSQPTPRPRHMINTSSTQQLEPPYVSLVGFTCVIMSDSVIFFGTNGGRRPLPPSAPKVRQRCVRQREGRRVLRGSRVSSFEQCLAIGPRVLRRVRQTARSSTEQKTCCTLYIVRRIICTWYLYCYIRTVQTCCRKSACSSPARR